MQLHIYLLAVAKLLLQVPLGVQLHDETRLDEMCAIMDELHRYVPQVAVTRSAIMYGTDIVRCLQFYLVVTSLL